MKHIGHHTLFTPAMTAAMGRWQRAFYGVNRRPGSHPTALAPALTGTLAELVTAELSLQITGGSSAQWLQAQLEDFLPRLQQAVQYAAAFGRCILRPLVRGDRITVELIPGDRFYPTRLREDGTPLAGYFADWRQAEGMELLRLEGFDYDPEHRRLTLTNRAYRLDGDRVKREIPLDSLPDWQELEPETVIEGVSGPLLGDLRMPFVGTVDPASRLPVSLWAGAEDSLVEFDRLWGEFLYELHSGKRKRIIERQALPGLSGKPVPGAPGYQDLATDTYLVLDPMEQQKPFDDYSPVLRTEEYLTGLKALLGLIETQCRLSPGTLRLEALAGSGQPATATEVVSRDKTTYHTCAAIQEQGVRPALEQLAEAIAALGVLYGLASQEDYALDIAFGDSIFEDTGAEFTRQMEMVKAGVLRPEKLLGWYFHTAEPEAYLPSQTADAVM